MQLLSGLGWRVHQTKDIGTMGMQGETYDKESFMGNAKNCPQIGAACKEMSIAVQVRKCEREM